MMEKQFNKRKSILVCLGLFILAMAATVTPVKAQYFEQKVYPQNYFQWPIGATKALAANFGELRNNHFHMGLDCKSDQRENMPVYAAAEGYIARIKVEPWGFGQAIYVNHPNGYTTLYAHLNKFYPELQQYVEAQQYLQKTWAISLELPPNKFPVKKGAFIANSGNTGGSMGPHLHFEIRDTKTDKVLNPLLFNFPIQDNIAPDVLRIAVYDRTKSTYEQSPKIYALKKVNGVYEPAGGKIFVSSEKVSFAFTAWDRYTGSTNQNGIYEAVLYNDEKPVCGFQLNNIDYLETRYLNGHIDYKTRFQGGPWLQHLSQLPGIPDLFYKSDESRGVLDMTNGASHKIKMIISDANGNKSTVAFTVVGNNITAPKPNNTPAAFQFKPEMLNVFEKPNVQFYLPQNYIYDSINFNYKELAGANGKTIYQLHNSSVPVHKYFTVKIKDNSISAPSDKMLIKRWFNNKQDYKKATLENGWYKADFRDLGYFQLMEDTQPPAITSLGLVDGMNASKLSRLVFSVTDNAEDLKSFDAWLDGEWLLFSNDKGRNFIYKFDDRCGPGKHELKVTAVDLAGNSTTKTYNFTR